MSEYLDKLVKEADAKLVSYSILFPLLVNYQLFIE
jgi:hypothetical protein